jgi:hypothetical protein
MRVHVLDIPDALIEWGKQDDIAIRFGRPWAHEVEELALLSQERPLDTAETDLLLARLEGLVVEALRAGLGSMLLQLDMLTAEWLGIWVDFKSEGSSVTMGRDLDWTYQELELLHGVGDKASDARAACEKVKALVAGVFPGARISAIVDGETTPARACTGCGKTGAAVMLTFESGNEYCFDCHQHLTTRMPAIEKKRSRKSKKR